MKGMVTATVAPLATVLGVASTEVAGRVAAATDAPAVAALMVMLVIGKNAEEMMMVAAVKRKAENKTLKKIKLKRNKINNTGQRYQNERILKKVAPLRVS